jgi:hypothetical protein
VVGSRFDDDAAERIREITANAYERSAERLPKESDTTVEFDWTDEWFVLERMGGVRGWTDSARHVTIDVNTGVGGWERSLRATVPHEYAHTYYFEQTGERTELDTTWEYVLFEAQSQQFAAAVSPDVEKPWRDHVEDEVLERWWPEIRDERLDEDAQAGAELFFGSEAVPHWLGYTLSYRVGDWLLDDHEIDEFPDLTKDDVIRAGDALYG